MNLRMNSSVIKKSSCFHLLFSIGERLYGAKPVDDIACLAEVDLVQGVPVEKKSTFIKIVSISIGSFLLCMYPK